MTRSHLWSQSLHFSFALLVSSSTLHDTAMVRPAVQQRSVRDAAIHELRAARAPHFQSHFTLLSWKCQDHVANAIALIRGKGHEADADVLEALYYHVPPLIIDDNTVSWGHSTEGTDIRLNFSQYEEFGSGMTCAQLDNLYAMDLYHELYHYDGGDDYSYGNNDCAFEDSENGNECLYYDSVWGRDNMHRNPNDDTYDP